jgi:hypothetical protein
MKNTSEKSLPGSTHNYMVCFKFKEINKKIKAPF